MAINSLGTSSSQTAFYPHLLQEEDSTSEKSTIAVTRAVKRALEGEQEVPPNKKPRLENKRIQLEDLIPKLRGAENHKLTVTIQVQTADGPFFIEIMKSQLLALSPHFERVFSNRMKESDSETMIWSGSSEMPNIHPQAAAQIIQFARKGMHFLDRECRSLTELKADFPDEFPVILNDIVRLCTYFEIHQLKEECLSFFKEELMSNLAGVMAEYLPLTLGNPEFTTFLSSALISLASQKEARAQIYPALVSLYHADYSDCTKMQLNSFQFYLKECFEKILECSAQGDEHDNLICQCFKELFPRFDLPVSLCKKMFLKVNQDPLGIPLVDRIMDFLRASRGSYPPQDLDVREQDDLQEYGLFINALRAPKAERKELLTLMITAYPENVYALCLRATQMEGNVDAVFAECNRAIELEPNYVFALRLRGECHKEKGNLDAAFVDLNRALELQPDTANALSARGDCHYRKGNPDAAIADFNRALELQPNDAFSLRGRGDCHRLKGNPDAAIADLDRALLLVPNNAFALNTRGDCHRRKGNLDTAIVDLNRSLELKPDNAIALAVRGDCHRRIGNLDAAFADCNRALELDPKSSSAFRVRGECHRLKDNLDAAIADFNRAFELQPNHVFTLTSRGDCYRQKGDLEAAWRDVNRMLEIDPTHKLALALKEKLLNQGVGKE